ncbi:hypothetical protein BDY24DRAFT_442361 [Mrakia frigida]|uniref:uncharacterized protein n=1 Tax=Mrakia frigida TaxID=29902 RepID=UPI003FCBF315
MAQEASLLPTLGLSDELWKSSDHQVITARENFLLTKIEAVLARNAVLEGQLGIDIEKEEKKENPPPSRIRLPWEILHLIFRFVSSPASIAVLARVSGKRRLIATSTITGIYSYLCLSQIKTLSIDLTSFDQPEQALPPLLPLPLTRMPGSYKNQPPLDFFKTSVPRDQIKLFELVLNLLPPLLDPLKFHTTFSGPFTFETESVLLVPNPPFVQ